MLVRYILVGLYNGKSGKVDVEEISDRRRTQNLDECL